MKIRYERGIKIPLKINECCNLLAGLINEHQQITFIIDALDECDDAETLFIHLNHFLKLVSGIKYSVRFFFSSRHQIEVCEQFPDCEKMKLEKCRDLTNEDMKVYIETQVRERKILRFGPRLLKGRCIGLENRLIKVLTKQSQGM